MPPISSGLNMWTRRLPKTVQITVASEAASPLVIGGPGAQQGPLDGASFGVLMLGEQQGRTEIPWPPITGAGIPWSCRKSSEYKRSSMALAA